MGMVTAGGGCKIGESVMPREISECIFFELMELAPGKVVPARSSIGA